MLTVKYRDGEEVEKDYCALCLKERTDGANFVMYDGDRPVALWRMKIVFEDEPVGLIDKVFFVDGLSEDDKLFFVHAMFFKLSEGAPVKLRVRGVREELRRFGFEEKNGDMQIYSRDIKLHYNCASQK